MIITRLFAHADSEAVHAICEQCWPGEHSHIVSDASDGSETWVAEINAVTVGFLQARPWQNWALIAGMEAHAPEADDAKIVNWLAVAPAHRGKGVGTRLLGDWLRSSTALYVFLTPSATSDDPDAGGRLRRFYVASGFRLMPESENPRPWLLGWSRLGAAPLPPSPPWPTEPTPAPEHTIPPSPEEVAALQRLKEQLQRPATCPGRVEPGTD